MAVPAFYLQDLVTANKMRKQLERHVELLVLPYWLAALTSLIASPSVNLVVISKKEIVVPSSLDLLNGKVEFPDAVDHEGCSCEV
jgi:hypothetical protein